MKQNSSSIVYAWIQSEDLVSEDQVWESENGKPPKRLSPEQGDKVIKDIHKLALSPNAKSIYRGNVDIRHTVDAFVITVISQVKDRANRQSTIVVYGEFPKQEQMDLGGFVAEKVNQFSKEFNRPLKPENLDTLRKYMKKVKANLKTEKDLKNIVCFVVLVLYVLGLLVSTLKKFFDL
ncbi:hypothetical protein PJF56_16640 [Roseofilum sp. BLCC_M91]|uniref:Uncharacterized protein n=1 Tax=Roseofilum halophilum BLCC-M91 TaxID=3022259 RepID=A0ABT7BMU1_9CYAN|nr:hypothetical protein [Roseofilum halophilum]MDJ1180491.1 hypothetical protein [Roseofilum halophilum BLCC-M91]